MDKEGLIELIEQETIEAIERRTLRANMSLSEAAEVCRSVAKGLNARAHLFDDEASVHK